VTAGSGRLYPALYILRRNGRHRVHRTAVPIFSPWSFRNETTLAVWYPQVSQDNRTGFFSISTGIRGAT
jgi:hypothetical protein